MKQTLPERIWTCVSHRLWPVRRHCARFQQTQRLPLPAEPPLAASLSWGLGEHCTERRGSTELQAAGTREASYGEQAGHTLHKHFTTIISGLKTKEMELFSAPHLVWGGVPVEIKNTASRQTMRHTSSPGCWNFTDLRGQNTFRIRCVAKHYHKRLGNAKHATVGA